MLVVPVAFLVCVTTCEAEAASPEAREWVKRSDEARARGDLEVALEAMQRAHEIDPAPQLANNIGFLLEQLGRYSEAAAAYEAVLEDPDTPAPLRRRDEARLLALRLKLDGAPVVLHAPDPSATIRIGALSSDQGPVEQVAPPGETLLEIVDGAEKQIVVRSISLARGRRTELSADVDRTAFGTVRLHGGRLRVVSIDGHRMREPPPPGFSLLLEPGEHRIDTVSADLTRASFDVLIRRGETMALSLALPAPPPPPPAIPPPVPADSNNTGPLVLWCVGAALAIAGAALVGSAYADVAQIGPGPISEVPFERAEMLNERARIKSPTGIGILVTAGVSLAAGTGWFLAD